MWVTHTHTHTHTIHTVCNSNSAPRSWRHTCVCVCVCVWHADYCCGSDLKAWTSSPTPVLRKHGPQRPQHKAQVLCTAARNRRCEEVHRSRQKFDGKIALKRCYPPKTVGQPLHGVSCVCVCVFVCVCASVYVYMHALVYACLSVRTCRWECICIRACI